MTQAPWIETWTVRKPAVESKGGVVATHHYLASDIGARILKDGGNAVDAAIAAGLAIPAVEPWMSGLGGGGFMMIYSAKEKRVQAVDFSMVAPQSIDPNDYPLTGGKGGGLFQWPAVVEDRNMLGYLSFAVPSYVAGIGLALETFGTRPWAEIVQPAVELAEAGMTVDWYTTLLTSTAVRDLVKFPESKRTYARDGFVPVGEAGQPLPTIHLGNLARTLKRLGQAGPRDFYEGEIAKQIAADVAKGGGRLSLDDLRAYKPRILPVTGTPYRGGTIHATPGLTAGPTFLKVFAQLGQKLKPGAGPDRDAYVAYGESLRDGYADRFKSMGEGADAATEVPSCTTHISVADKDGNLVALTQTLLSVFGSRVMLPETGILMNNGVMWFDPKPGGPNSIAPGRRPLTNMCPTIVERADGFKFAIGASGGRRIMPAVTQLTSFLVDYKMTMDQAFHTPRIDASGTEKVTADVRLPVASLAKTLSVEAAPHGVFPAMYACPNAAGRDSTKGVSSGGAYVMSPWAKVSPEN